MTDIIFSFDTEDYANPRSADGLLRTCRLLEKHGIRGCFQIVGRFAEALERWGRYDIIEALKCHEIDTHSLAHSYHPTINEYTDIDDFDEAMKRFMTDETKSVAILKRIFGREHFPATCPPGNSASYVAHYGYHDLGVSVYADDFSIDEKRGRPVSFCNLLSTAYDLCLDWFLYERNGENNEVLRVRTEKEIMDALTVAKEKELYVLYHHPSMSMQIEWWDVQNCFGENRPEGEWLEARQLPKDTVDAFFARFEFLIEAIKASPDFRITTFEELAKKHTAARTITLDMLPDIRQQLDEYWFPITLPDSLCLSDIFLAARDFLVGQAEHTCGAVYGFLETPCAVSVPVTLTREDIVASAKAMNIERWLPRSITVNGVTIGPADWLRAALAILCGEESYTVTPAAWQIDMSQFSRLRDVNYAHSWVNITHLEDDYLSRRGRLQAWTIRLPKDTPRRVFD